LSDDRLGRALDRLFEADRAALLTDVVLAVAKRFAVQLQQLDNDSTSIAFCGQCRDQRPSSRSGKRASAIAYSYSKDHRPGLKQLLLLQASQWCTAPNSLVGGQAVPSAS
jgi:hypothetical protein